MNYQELADQADHMAMTLSADAELKIRAMAKEAVEGRIGCAEGTRWHFPVIGPRMGHQSWAPGPLPPSQTSYRHIAVDLPHGVADGAARLLLVEEQIRRQWRADGAPFQALKQTQHWEHEQAERYMRRIVSMGRNASPQRMEYLVKLAAGAVESMVRAKSVAA